MWFLKLVGILILIVIVVSIIGRLTRFPIIAFGVPIVFGIIIGITNDPWWWGIVAWFGATMVLGMCSGFVNKK